MVKVLIETLKKFKPHHKKRASTFLTCDDSENLEKCLKNYCSTNDCLIVKSKKEENFETIWEEFQNLLKFYDLADQKIVVAGKSLVIL